MPPDDPTPISGEVQQQVGGRWVTVRLGNVRVTDRRRVTTDPQPPKRPGSDDAA